MRVLLVLCALLALARGDLLRAEDAKGKWSCKDVDNAKEKALIDHGAFTKGHVASAEIWSSKTKKFTITSVKDQDKKEDQACLTGHSWLSNSATDKNPMLTAEFGKSLSICGIVLSGRPDWGNDRAVEFNMRLSGDNKNWAKAQDRFNDDKEDFIGLVKEEGKYYKTCLFTKPIESNFMKLTKKKLVPGAALAVRVGFLYNCKYTDGCKPNPCLNGASCVSQPFGLFKCTCKPGFTGKRCEKKSAGPATSGGGGCGAAPCKNGGKCSPITSGFTCKCPTGWTGDTCTQKVVGDVMRIGCTFQMQDGRLAHHKEYEPINVICPPHKTCAQAKSTTIWGSPHYYTDDSPMCKTAVQTFGPDHLTEGRVITAYKVGKHKDYMPSMRHMIFSSRFTREMWPGYTWDINVVKQIKKGRK